MVRLTPSSHAPRTLCSAGGSATAASEPPSPIPALTEARVRVPTPKRLPDRIESLVHLGRKRTHRRSCREAPPEHRPPLETCTVVKGANPKADSQHRADRRPHEPLKHPNLATSAGAARRLRQLRLCPWMDPRCRSAPRRLLRSGHRLPALAVVSVLAGKPVWSGRAEARPADVTLTEVGASTETRASFQLLLWCGTSPGHRAR